MTRKQWPAAWGWSVAVTLAMVLITWQSATVTALALSIPFSLSVYLLYFSIGTAPLAVPLQQWCGGRWWRLLLLPLALAALLYLYVLLTGGTPWQGHGWQIPLLFCVPVLFYRWSGASGTAITWRDGVAVGLCVLPYALHDYPFDSHLPIGSDGIETLYLTTAIIVAVYAVVVVRQIKGVGFEFALSRHSVKLSMVCWVLFFPLVLVFGIPGGLMKWTGYEPLTPVVMIAGVGHVLQTLFGTALPEELLFRGVLMNLLQKRLEQTGLWQRYLKGSLLLLPLAVLAGYSIDDRLLWFPLLCAIVLWGAAAGLCRRDSAQAPLYTALLMVSTMFGLVHYHMQSSLFIGLAMFAGWTYGYVYHKTGSVFYSALTHTLVNVSPSWFGLMLVR